MLTTLPSGQVTNSCTVPKSEYNPRANDTAAAIHNRIYHRRIISEAESGMRGSKRKTYEDLALKCQPHESE